MLKKWIATLIVIAESVFVAGKLDAPLSVNIIFITLSILGSIAYIICLDDEYDSVLLRLICALVLIPVISYILVLALSFLLGVLDFIFKLGLDGTISIGILIVVIGAVLSSCVFIVFF